MAHKVLLTSVGKVLLVRAGVALSIRNIPVFIKVNNDQLSVIAVGEGSLLQGTAIASSLSVPTTIDSLLSPVGFDQSVIVPEISSEQMLCNGETC